jgi:hypothetical protein
VSAQGIAPGANLGSGQAISLGAAIVAPTAPAPTANATPAAEKAADQAIALDAIVAVGYPAPGASTRSPAAPAALSARSALAEPLLDQSWTPATRSDAERRLGTPVVTIPGLPVAGFEIGEQDGDPVVRIRHALSGGGILLLVERVGAYPVVTPALDGLVVVTGRNGNLYLAATAELARDRLVELLATAN